MKHRSSQQTLYQNMQYKAKLKQSQKDPSQKYQNDN